MNNNVKPGWQTTEFWITVVITILGALELAGVIGTEDANAWIELFKPLILVIVPAVYTYSRMQVKRGG